ncbi:MAG: hypothetical protein HQ510_04985 [Candidatus Marinimicrobia bacterium]|nr:hypothetical protein [Candidatus Neomarinimicrobiota bacterium]
MRKIFFEKTNLWGMVVILTVLLSGCSFFTSYGRYVVRAEKAYKSGDYDSAVEYCVASISENPSYEKSSELLDKVFPKCIEFHHMKIERFSISDDEFRWDKVVREYEDLSYLVDILEKLDLPQTEVLLFKSEVKNYQTLLTDAKNYAAEAHYQAGIQFMEVDNREGYKKAADHFKSAMTFVHNYVDSASFYETCRQNAITRIAIMSFENSSGEEKYGNVGEQISNQLLSSLMNDQEIMEFVEFVTRDKIDLILNEQQLASSGLVNDEHSIEIGNILGVHHTITGTITHVSATEPQHLKDRKRMEKRIVTDTETYSDEDGNELEREIYRLVRADAIFNKIQAEAMINVSYKIMDVTTAKIIYSNNLSSNYTFEFDWVTYSGDGRALTFLARMLAGNSQQPTPSKAELVQKAVEILASKLVADIKNTLK